MGGRIFDRFRDRDAQATRRIRVVGEDAATGVGHVGGRRVHGRAPRLHHRPAIGFLLVRHLDHVDRDLEAEQRAGKGERRAPLSGSRLGGQPLHALFGVVVGLGYGGVGLVRTGGRDSFVLVVDVRRRVQRLLEAIGAIDRAWPPDAINLSHLVRDLDPRFGRHLLRDDRLREDRREVGGTHRLQGLGVEIRRRRCRHVRQDVVPALRDIVLVEQDLLGHGLPAS